MSAFVKTVTDRYDDTAKVTVESMRHVYMDVVETGRGRAMLSLSPEQARRLAKALRKAAKIAKENA